MSKLDSLVTTLEGDLRNLLSKLRDGQWNGRDLVITAHCVIEDISRILVWKHFDLNRLHWNDPIPLERMQGGVLLRILGEHKILQAGGAADIKGGLYRLDSIHEALENEVNYRNTRAAHDTSSVP